ISEMLRKELDPIRNDIKELKEGQSRLERSQDQFSKRQDRFEESQEEFSKRQDRFEESQEEFRKDIKGLKEGQQSIEKGQEKLEKGQERLEKGQREIRQLVEELDPKNANRHRELQASINELRKNLTNVEIITSSNWNEIARLKKIK